MHTSSVSDGLSIHLRLLFLALSFLTVAGEDAAFVVVVVLLVFNEGDFCLLRDDYAVAVVDVDYYCRTLLDGSLDVDVVLASSFSVDCLALRLTPPRAALADESAFFLLFLESKLSRSRCI